jgi:hypothetical protein
LILAPASFAVAQPDPDFGYRVNTYVDVYVEHVDDDSIAGRVASLHSRARAAVEDRLGLVMPPRPHVIVAPNDREFARRYRALAGSDPGASVLAVAFTAYHRVIIRQSGLREGTDAGLRRTYEHELAHLCLATLERRHNGRLPRWLNEGLSEWAAGREPTFEENNAISGWARFGKLPPLSDWETEFPQHGSATSRSYTISMAFVCWLDAERGSVRGLVEALGTTFDVDEAFRQAFGSDVRTLEIEWKLEQSQDHGWLWTLVLGLDVWGLTALLAVVAIFRHIWVTRRKKRELLEQDLAEDAAREAARRALLGGD